MRCALNRDLLAEALGTVVSIVPSRSTYPVFHNILLEIEQGRLAITGTDGDNVVRQEVKLEGKSEDGSVLVDGRRLTELVRMSNAETVTLKTTETKVAFESGRMKAELLQLAPEQFPELPKLPQEIQFEFPLATLFEMYDICSFAVSRDDSRPVMTAINWEVGKSESRMVATDAVRLAFVSRKVKVPVKTKLLLVPKAVNILPRGEEKVQVYADQKMVGFRLENTTVISRTIEGPYPDYERVIPKNMPAKAVVSRESLAGALRRAMVMAHPVSKQISIEFTAKSMIIRAKSEETGDSEEELDCSYKGEELTVGFNGGFLLDILNHIGTEELTIELSTPMSPVMVKPVSEEQNGEELFIMMPVRLD